MSLTAIVFALAFLGGMFLCVARHPIFGLYTYVAVFYLNPPSRWWSEGLPDLRWAFVAAAVTFGATLLRSGTGFRKKWLSHRPALLFCVYVLWMWIQFPWVVDTSAHAYGVGYFTKYLIVFYLIYALVDSSRHLAGFLTIHAAGCLYLGLLAFSFGGSGRVDGVGGPGIDDANSLGMQLSTGAFAGAAVFLASVSNWKWVGALAVPFAMNGVVLAGSRGGFLGLVAGGFAFFLFRPRRALFVTTAAAGAGLVLFFVLATAQFWERVATILQPVESKVVEDASIGTRIALVPAQLAMARDYPFGAGFDGTTALSFTYIDVRYHSGREGRSSHNTLLSALVDQGVPGLILWVWMIAATGTLLLRVRQWARVHDDRSLSWMAAGVAAMTATVIVAGLFAPYLNKEVYIWCLALACAMASITSVPKLVAETERRLDEVHLVRTPLRSSLGE
jgi:hypothetical protein